MAKKAILIFKPNLPVSSMCLLPSFVAVGAVDVGVSVREIIWRTLLVRIGAPATWPVIIATAIIIERDILPDTVIYLGEVVVVELYFSCGEGVCHVNI
jgi:hypothetical protein